MKNGTASGIYDFRSMVNMHAPLRVNTFNYPPFTPAIAILHKSPGIVKTGNGVHHLSTVLSSRE